jgi:C4-type Zn-finger protein
MQKDCPMCGDFMRIEIRETVDHIPGTLQEVRTITREWICKECDYFEDVEDYVETPKPD